MNKNDEESKKEMEEYSKLNHRSNLKDKEKIKIENEIKFLLIMYSISLIMLILRIIPKIVCNFCIFLFPFLETNKILLEEEKISNNYKKWILYWLLYAFFIIIDDIAILIKEIFPFYYLIKFFIFSWLALPNFEGCEFILENYFLDFIQKIKNLLKMNHMNKSISSELNDYFQGK